MEDNSLKSLIRWIGVGIIFLCLTVFVGCDFAESGLVKEQAVTFEQEIAYRQRK